MLDKLVAEAEFAQAQGRLPEAEKLAKEVLAGAPENVRAQVVLALIEAKTGRTQSAMSRFTQVLEEAPGNFDATFWLSVLYRQSGRFAESVEFAARAVPLMPLEAHVHSNMGLSCLATHDLTQAISCFKRAAEIDPRIAPNFHHLGRALQMQGLDGEAVQAFRRALALAPNSMETLLLLGQTLMNQQDTAAAADCARRALLLRPNSSTAELLFANALISEDRIEEAEEHIKRVIELDPKEGTAHAMLGMRLQGLGRLDEANASFRRSIELQPEQGFAYCALIRNHKVAQDDEPTLAEMERLVRLGTLPLRGQSFLHYGLGKAYEDLKDYEKAMRHFDEANRISYLLRFGSAKFDKDAYIRSIDWIIETFSRGFFEGAGGSGSVEDRPILIVGMMRSGTTLVEQILSSHPAIEARGEQPFWMRRGSETISARTGKPERAALGKLATEYVALLADRAPGARYLTDKMPDNYLQLGLIHAALPNVRFIHTRRHPIDTCISIYTTPNRTSDPYANDRENIVFAYEQYLRLMDHWRRVIPANRLMEVRYEDLVSNPEPVTREMLSFCGVEWNDACLHPEENERAVATPSVWQVRQPVYGTSVDRWKRYASWLREFARLGIGISLE